VEISEAAAPVRRAVEKVRLFIISLPSGLDGMSGSWRKRAESFSTFEHAAHLLGAITIA
jgi:hypothetical protein